VHSLQFALSLGESRNASLSRRDFAKNLILNAFCANNLQRNPGIILLKKFSACGSHCRSAKAATLPFPGAILPKTSF
jgi:hypothetical protein